jgi:hypothetical protein
MPGSKFVPTIQTEPQSFCKRTCNVPRFNSWPSAVVLCMMEDSFAVDLVFMGGVEC